jgi:hypothetical protein
MQDYKISCLPIKNSYLKVMDNPTHILGDPTNWLKEA